MKLSEIKPILKDTVTEYSTIFSDYSYSIDLTDANPEFKLLNAIFNPNTILDDFEVAGVYVNSAGSGFSVDFEGSKEIVEAIYEYALKNNLEVKKSYFEI